MLLYIIRHGETELNVKGCLQGQVDEPLNQNGRDLAKITGEALKDIPFDLVITSPLKRAKETALLVVEPSQRNFGKEIPILEEDKLMEINWGSWEAMGCMEHNFNIPCDHFNLFYTDAFHFDGAPDGESPSDVCERTSQFMDELMKNQEYKDKTILISTHGCAMRGMLNQFYEDKTDFWHGHVPYNCAVNILEIKDGQAKLLAEDKIYYDESLCVNNYKAITAE